MKTQVHDPETGKLKLDMNHSDEANGTRPILVP